jgi:hypothetical protein
MEGYRGSVGKSLWWPDDAEVEPVDGYWLLLAQYESLGSDWRLWAVQDMFEESDGMKPGIRTYARSSSARPRFGVVFHCPTSQWQRTDMDRCGVMIPDQTRGSGSLSRALA